MSIINVRDLAYVGFSVPDIDRQRSFLLDFGLTEVGTHDGAVYFRGQGNAPFCYVVSQGDAAFTSFGFWANDRADLERIAAHCATAVEESNAPGGGLKTVLTDPDGYRIEILADQDDADPIPHATPLPWNEDGHHPRVSSFRRVERQPSKVLRLGHLVLSVTDFAKSEAWYKERFGLMTSDEVQVADGIALGAFLRCNRGEIPTDHHTLFLMQLPGGPAKFMHAAFEVAGVDDLMVGHDMLQKAGHQHHWGVGRHILGSQVFDYWLDPHGFELEHWTDGDQLKASDGGGIATFDQLMSVQWGMAMPPLPEGPLPIG